MKYFTLNVYFKNVAVYSEKITPKNKTFTANNNFFKP